MSGPAAHTLLRRARRIATALPLCFAASMAVAQGRADDRLVAVDGEEITGALLGVSADGIVRVRAGRGEIRELALDQLTQIQLAAVGPRGSESLPDSVWLRSGQALPTTFASFGEAGAALRLWFARGEIVVPWRFVEAVRFDGSAAPDRGFLAAVAEHGSERHLVYAKGEDGHVVRVSADRVSVQADRVQVGIGTEERELPIERVHGIVFARLAGTRPDPLPKPRVRATLVNGDSVAGKLGRVDEANCHLLLPEGITLDIDRASLTRLDVETDRMLVLTDLQPSVEQVPALDTVWQPLVDRRPGGGEIRLGGKRYARGLVLVPFTRATYALDGTYDYFSAVIGFEDGAGTLGEAVFRVRGDGKVLFDSGVMNAADPPRSIEIPTSGIRELALEADFGSWLDFGCICVFAAPRLRKG